MKKIKKAELEKILNKSQKNLSNKENVKIYISEIEEILESSIDKKTKCVIALKLSHSISLALASAELFYTDLIELLKALIPLITDDYWTKFLSIFKYIFHFFVSKECLKEAFNVIQLLDIKSTEDENAIRIYFEIYKDWYSKIVYTEMKNSGMSQATEQYFNGLKSILEMALAHNISQTLFEPLKSLFWTFLQELFNSHNNFKCLIGKFEKTSIFFTKILFSLLIEFGKLFNPKISGSLEDFFTFLTTLLIQILTLELNYSRNSQQTGVLNLSVTIEYLELIQKIPIFVRNKFYNNIFSTFYNLIKCFTHEQKKFNKEFGKIMEKQILVLFDSAYADSILFNIKKVSSMDTIATLTEILYIFHKELCDNLDENNLSRIFNDLLENLMRKCCLIKLNDKTFCNKCKKLNRHEILNVGQLTAILSTRLIKIFKCSSVNSKQTSIILAQKDTIWSTILLILNYANEIMKSFDCEDAKLMWNNTLIKYFISMRDIVEDDKVSANFAIITLKLLNTSGVYKNKVTQIYLANIWRKLFETIENYKLAMKFACVHIVYKLRQNALSATKEHEFKEDDLHELVTNRKFQIINSELVNLCKMYEKCKGVSEIMSICDILNDIRKSYNPEMINIPSTASDDVYLCQLFEIPENYDAKFLLLAQFRVVMKYYPKSIKLQEALFEKCLQLFNNPFDCSFDLEFATFVHKLRDPNQIEKVITKIENESKIYPHDSSNIEQCISTARLNFTFVCYKLEKLKKAIEKKLVSEEILISTEINKFSSISIDKENDILDCIHVVLDSYKKFFFALKSKTGKNASLSSIEELYPNLDWTEIFDNLIYLARHLILRGYIQHAFNTYYFVYTMTSTISGQNLFRIQALSFFAEYYCFIKEFLQKESMDLRNQFELEFEQLISLFNETSKTLLPRQQNYVFMCMLNLVNFYNYEGDFQAANAIKQIVLSKIDSMKERKKKFELVKAKIYALEFYKITKYIQNTTNITDSEVEISPFNFILNLIDEVRNITYVTSEDSINIPTLLFNFIQEIAYFLLNRLCASSAKVFLYMMIKFAAEFGLSLRFCQLLTLLSQSDLQMEDVKNFQMKLVIIDCILMKTPSSIIASPVSPVEKCKTKNTLEVPSLNKVFIETMRKAIPNTSVSPKNMKFMELQAISHDEYLINHSNSCKCEICRNEFIQVIAFEAGCLYARSLYLTGNYHDSKIFYSEAINWWQKFFKKQSYDIESIFINNFMFMLTHYLNILRRLDNESELQKIYEISLKNYQKNYKYLDISYFHNFVEQITSFNYNLEKKFDEKQPDEKLKLGNKLVNCKKILSFSPLITQPTASKITSNNTGEGSSGSKENLTKEKTAVQRKNTLESFLKENSTKTSLRKKEVIGSNFGGKMNLSSEKENCLKVNNVQEVKSDSKITKPRECSAIPVRKLCKSNQAKIIEVDVENKKSTVSSAKSIRLTRRKI